MKGAHRLSCAFSPRAKERLHRNLGQTCLWFLEDLLGKQGVTVTHCGGRTLEAKVLGIIISMCSSRGGHFGKICPHPSVNRLPKEPPGTQPPLISPRDKAPPTRGIGISSTYQWAGTTPSHQEAYSKPPLPRPIPTSATRGADTRSKRGYNSIVCKRGDHTKNLYKMKRQRFMTQIREQEETPEKQLSELAIINLHEKDLRLMIVKMI